MKSAKAMLDIIEHYLADKKGIAVGHHYPLSHFRPADREWRHHNTAIFTYEIRDSRFEVLAHRQPNDYYRVDRIHQRRDISLLEVLL